MGNNKKNFLGVNGSGVNICTSLFRTTFQITLLGLSYLCRWASCRGSLPQPMVVLLLFASAVSAPKGRRFLTIAFTTIALRTTAELIHGLKYGPHDDWDDYYYDDDDNDDDDLESTDTNTKRRRLPSSQHSSISNEKKMTTNNEETDDTSSKHKNSKNNN